MTSVWTQSAVLLASIDRIIGLNPVVLSLLDNRMAFRLGLIDAEYTNSWSLSYASVDGRPRWRAFDYILRQRVQIYVGG